MPQYPRPCAPRPPTPDTLRQRFRDEVETEVAAMEGYDGSAAAIDLVSLVCLSRSTRTPGANDREATEPHPVIEELHVRATRLLRLATFMHNMAALTAEQPIARLARSIRRIS